LTCTEACTCFYSPELNCHIAIDPLKFLAILGAFLNGWPGWPLILTWGPFIRGCKNKKKQLTGDIWPRDRMDTYLESDTRDMITYGLVPLMGYFDPKKHAWGFHTAKRISSRKRHSVYGNETQRADYNEALRSGQFRHITTDQQFHGAGHIVPSR